MDSYASVLEYSKLIEKYAKINGIGRWNCTAHDYRLFIQYDAQSTIYNYWWIIKIYYYVVRNQKMYRTEQSGQWWWQWMIICLKSTHIAFWLCCMLKCMVYFSWLLGWVRSKVEIWPKEPPQNEIPLRVHARQLTKSSTASVEHCKLNRTDIEMERVSERERVRDSAN